ncbi:hypothetical protein [Legionella septentrionalis]|uniref:hypothetical protein n=1 Tax=Legionella septentrionalis TaxID=2498109 RepID=UPI000F8ED6E6|nr:hypothetical protein [Legionella septentrionalis]RUR14306.1 hypothetical protein ELY10_09115 [Legionella septentrionalis]
MKRIMTYVLLFIATFSHFSAHAYGYGNYPERHYHGHNDYYNYWGEPQIIVSVPRTPRPYVYECETIEVCDDYTDECWLERHCR